MLLKDEKKRAFIILRRAKKKTKKKFDKRRVHGARKYSPAHNSRWASCTNSKASNDSHSCLLYLLPSTLSLSLLLSYECVHFFPSPLFFLPRFNRQRAWLTKHARAAMRFCAIPNARVHHAHQLRGIGAEAEFFAPPYISTISRWLTKTNR